MKMRCKGSILAKDRTHFVHERSLLSQQENFSAVKDDLINSDLYHMLHLCTMSENVSIHRC